MNFSYYILGGFVVFWIVYLLFILPKIKKRHENKTEDIKNKLVGNESQERDKLLNDPQGLKLIVDQVAGENIIGIANCMEKRDMGNVLKDGALNATGKVLGKVTGVRVEKRNNLDVYFVVLTDTNLHYLVYDEGTCDEHLTYDRSIMQNFRVEKAAMSASVKGGGMGTDQLSFDYEGKNHAFFLYRLFANFPHQDGGFTDIGLSDKKVFATELFTKPMFEAIG